MQHNPFQRWSKEFLAATITGFALWVAPMTWYVRLTGAFVLWVLVSDLIRRYPWPSSISIALSMSFALALGFLEYPVVCADYKEAHPAPAIPSPLKLQILPGDTLNAQDALATRFTLIDQDANPISNWWYVCQIKIPHDNVIHADIDQDHYGVLESGASFSLFCDYRTVDGISLTHALLGISVFYHQAAQPKTIFIYNSLFILERNQNTSAANWLPDGSGMSIKDMENFFIAEQVN